MRRRSPRDNHFFACLLYMSGVIPLKKPMGLCFAIFSDRPSSTRQVPSIVNVSRLETVLTTVAGRRDRVGFMSGVTIQGNLFTRSCLVNSKNPVEVNESV